MGSESESKIKLKAYDGMSGVIDKIKAKFPQLSTSIDQTASRFKLLQENSKNFNKSMSKIGDKVTGVGKGMSTFITAPVAAFGAFSLKTATEFQDSMNKVQAMTGASTDEMEKMRQMAKDLGASTAFSAKEAADAMSFFGQAGFDANQILQATPATLSLASASGTDLARSADILSNVMGGFNVKADQAGRFVDIMAMATAKGNIDMEMLSETMKDAAPVAQKFGASIEETSALTAKLGDAGIQGGKAGTTLKNMFLNLSAPTEKIKSLIGALGVQTVDKASGKMRSMTDILSQMGKAFESKGITGAKKLAILNEIFGDRAIAGAGVLIDAVGKVDATTGLNSVQELTKALENSTGSAAQMQKTMEKGLPGAFRNLSSAVEGVQLALFDMDFGGKKLSERIVDIVDGITGFIQSLSTTNQSILKWGAGIAAIAALVGPFIVGLGLVIGFIPTLVTGINLLVAGFGILKATMIATTLAAGPMLVALGLFAAAGVMIYKNWQPIKTFFADLFTSPLQQLKDMIGFVGSFGALKNTFGFGKVDSDLKAQGFNIQEQGAETGSRVMVKESAQNKLREKKAMVDINFSNVPKDTKVIADDRDSIIGSLTGFMGIGG
jgi:TP901 family phage tail tape measure protein